MKKFTGLLVVGVSALVLSGCGGGGGSDYYAPEVTYYLQTYNEFTDTYEGVSDVYYECGPDIVGYTGDDGVPGSFTMIEGDYCTFYDLDNTVSYEYDLLYIGSDRWGDYSVSDVRYDCDSGSNGYTDELGTFVFDPTYISQYSDGDICGFDFY